MPYSPLTRAQAKTTKRRLSAQPVIHFDPYASLLDTPMPKKNHDRTRSLLKEPWPILAVGVGLAGLLAWIGWEVTRPEKAGAERR